MVVDVGGEELEVLTRIGGIGGHCFRGLEEDPVEKLGDSGQPGGKQFVVRVLQSGQQHGIAVRSRKRQPRVIGNRLLHRIEELIKRRLIRARVRFGVRRCDRHRNSTRNCCRSN
jgi:hypothetical protein